MARSFNGTTGNYLSLGTAGGVGAVGPWSCSAWLLPTGIQNGCIISKRASYGANSNQFDFSVYSSTTLRGLITRDAQYAITTQFYTQNVWNHGACACDSAGVLFYINGGAATFDSGLGGTNFSGNWSSGQGTPNQPAWIGITDSTPTTPFKGSLAQVAVWNVKLTAGELIALSKGVNPFAIRRTSLVMFFPLYGLASPEPGLAGIAPLTGAVTGAIYADGPPTAMFTPRWRQEVLPTSAATFIPAWAQQINLPVLGTGIH